MLSTLEKELVAYAESFYTDDEQLNRNLRLKLAHTCLLYTSPSPRD